MLLSLIITLDFNLILFQELESFPATHEEKNESLQVGRDLRGPVCCPPEHRPLRDMLAGSVSSLLRLPLVWGAHHLHAAHFDSGQVCL